jgi:hypothetical protein
MEDNQATVLKTSLEMVSDGGWRRGHSYAPWTLVRAVECDITAVIRGRITVVPRA